MHYDNDSTASVTLAGSDGTRVSNLADGVDVADAVNKGQLDTGDASTLAAAQVHADEGDAATLQSANAYTETTATQTLNSANAYTDSKFSAWSDTLDTFSHQINQRLSRQDRRIDRQGAMGAAMLNMAINAAGSQSTRGRVAVGAGFQGGERALSVGYGKQLGTHASFSLGGAFSKSETSAGVGFGLDL